MVDGVVRVFTCLGLGYLASACSDGRSIRKSKELMDYLENVTVVDVDGRCDENDLFSGTRIDTRTREGSEIVVKNTAEYSAGLKVSQLHERGHHAYRSRYVDGVIEGNLHGLWHGMIITQLEYRRGVASAQTYPKGGPRHTPLTVTPRPCDKHCEEKIKRIRACKLTCSEFWKPMPSGVVEDGVHRAEVCGDKWLNQ